MDYQSYLPNQVDQSQLLQVMNTVFYVKKNELSDMLEQMVIKDFDSVEIRRYVQNSFSENAVRKKLELIYRE